MTALSREAAEDLGRLLQAEGFQPLPDADDHGMLIGTRLWRVRGEYVEYLALRQNGFAQAVRAEARFDYQRPAAHGRIVEQRSGYAINALDWLLATSDERPGSALQRPYISPTTADQSDSPPHHRPGAT